MSKYVPDISSRRWVIIADNRENRPDENKEKEEFCDLCPFCPGNETLTPEELYRVGAGDSGQPGWEVRVIPNKFPITDFHEVIIHSPLETDLHHLPKDHIIKVFQTYRARYEANKKRGQVMIFCNRGEHAGASIRHPHTQLVVLPDQINMSTLVREPMDNIVLENTFFNIYCPDFSQWPYEVWVVPKKQDGLFGDIADDEIVDMVDIYVDILNRLEKLHATKSQTGQGFSYNFYIYPKENWYMRIIPRFVYRAGFELGTGLSVNVIDPRDAAHELGMNNKQQTLNNKQEESEIIEEKQEEIDRLKNKLKRLGVG